MAYGEMAAYYEELFSSLPKNEALLLFDLVRHVEEGLMGWSNSLKNEVDFGSTQIETEKSSKQVKEDYCRGLLCGVSLDYLEYFGEDFRLLPVAEMKGTKTLGIVITSYWDENGHERNMGEHIKVSERYCEQFATPTAEYFGGWIPHKLNRIDYILYGERNGKPSFPIEDM